MKNIILSTILVLVAATVFASTQTQTTQDKPWQVYVLGAAMNTSDNNHSIENDYFYPDYPQSNLLYTVDSQTTSGTSVAWLNGLGGSGSGAFLDSSISDGFFYTYTNYDNSGENDSINLDWSGVGSDYQTYPKWGSDSGNSYDYTNFYSINSYVTISSYVVNEHCDVTVPQAQRPFLSYLETGTTIGDVLKQVTETETYQRYAQAAWHVRTGGKAIPGRQSLWQFSGWAQSVTNMRAGPPYNAGDTQPVTNPKAIALGDIGNLQSDGTLWRTLPDNSDTDITPTISGNDFYQFGVSGTKYILNISASTNGAAVDLSSNTPEFCVGQQISFTLQGLPMGNIVNMVGQWSLPQKYVNEVYQPYELFSPAPTVYDINSGLLANTNQISCWYVNGQGGQISVGLNLKFNDGQYASVAALGNFTVYRPTSSHFIQNQHGFSWSPGQLVGVMAWGVKLDSKYDGLFGETQVLNSGNENSDYYTGGNDYLDGNSEIYGTQNANGPSVYTASNPNTHSISFIDNPTDYGACANMFADFKDYLRFQPAGSGSIYVTVSTNSWYMNGAACLIGTIAPNDLPAATTPVNDDTFPSWVNVRHGGN